MQIEESLIAHTSLNRWERRARALDLMNSVGIPAAERRLREYPHQFSRGMRQRASLASRSSADAGHADFEHDLTTVLHG
ncbi:MAG: hypothetical protein ABIQ51_00655 [Mesorhizobium sp.]